MYTSLEELKKDFHLRPARMEDAQIVSDLFNLCSRDVIAKDEFEPGELTAGWESGSLNMETDTLMVFEQDVLIAYADFWGILPPYVRINTWVRVHPAYKNRGIGWALNVWLEKRGLEMTQAAEKELQIFTMSYTNVKDVDTVQLLSDLGYKKVRYSWLMEANLPDEIPSYELPSGVRIVPIPPSEYKRIYYLKEEIFEDHWGHIGTTDEEGIKEFETEYLLDPNYDPELWFAAEVDGEWVGMIYGNKSTPFGKDYGWVSILGVNRDWRSKGVAKALMLHFFQKIKENGSNKVGLSVDSDSLTGATKLYEAVGMYVIEQYVRMEKILRDGIDLRVRGLNQA